MEHEREVSRAWTARRRGWGGRGGMRAATLSLPCTLQRRLLPHTSQPTAIKNFTSGGLVSPLIHHTRKSFHRKPPRSGGVLTIYETRRRCICGSSRTIFSLCTMAIITVVIMVAAAVAVVIQPTISRRQRHLLPFPMQAVTKAVSSSSSSSSSSHTQITSHLQACVTIHPSFLRASCKQRHPLLRGCFRDTL